MAGSKIGIGLGRRLAEVEKARAGKHVELASERVEPPPPRPLGARELIAMARSARKAASEAYRFPIGSGHRILNSCDRCQFQRQGSRPTESAARMKTRKPLDQQLRDEPARHRDGALYRPATADA